MSLVPVPIVAIEISAPAPPAPADVQVLVAACNHAASGAKCVQAQSDEIDTTPAAVAIVAWQGDQIARLEVGVRSEGATRWTTRKLEFREGDELPECWRTIGFVIGTIVGQSSPEADGVLPVRAPRTPAPSRPPKSTRRAPARLKEPPKARPVGPSRQTASVLWLEGTGSPVSWSGPWLAGARVRGAGGELSWPILVSSSIGYAWQLVPVESIRAKWLTATLGVRYAPLGLRRWSSVGVSLEALVRRQGFSSVAPDGDRAEAQRWLGGLQLGADGALEVTPHFWVGVAGDAFLLQGNTNITQFGEKNVYGQSSFGGDLALGIAYRL